MHKKDHHLTSLFAIKYKPDNTFIGTERNVNLYKTASAASVAMKRVSKGKESPSYGKHHTWEPIPIEELEVVQIVTIQLASYRNVVHSLSDDALSMLVESGDLPESEFDNRFPE